MSEANHAVDLMLLEIVTYQSICNSSMAEPHSSTCLQVKRYTQVLFLVHSAVALVTHQGCRLRTSSFVPHVRPSSRDVINRRLVAAPAMHQVVDLVGLAPHIDALVAHGSTQSFADASSLYLADAINQMAEVAEKVDNGWFGTGLLKGVDPWGTWRGFIQGSIVTTHDFLVAQGVKENSWGLALMLFTFSLRALTLPLTWFQFASTEKQKALAVDVPSLSLFPSMMKTRLVFVSEVVSSMGTYAHPCMLCSRS